ncbi:hypothetical protein, partial [Methylocystis parvus]|uniref:hypothetical protein n=1 Tax=Methylocystis parvus TaxID=134 RepID=UPI001AEBB10D
SPLRTKYFDESNSISLNSLDHSAKPGELRIFPSRSGCALKNFLASLSLLGDMRRTPDLSISLNKAEKTLLASPEDTGVRAIG